MPMCDISGMRAWGHELNVHEMGVFVMSCIGSGRAL